MWPRYVVVSLYIGKTYSIYKDYLFVFIHKSSIVYTAIEYMAVTDTHALSRLRTGRQAGSKCLASGMFPETAGTMDHIIR